MFDDLLSALQRLDNLIEQAVIKAEAVYGSEVAEQYRLKLAETNFWFI